MRLDFLSNERPVLATRVGTYAGRALHSNHMPSRVWAEYAALDVARASRSIPALREIMKGSGRGYYRPPSLLSLWAQAPFMHNNAIGPEVCGKPSRREVDFYSSPYVDQNDRPLANPPPCVPFDPSVEGRYKLYKDSMQDLLNPSRRLRKVTVTDDDIVIDVAPDFKLGGVEGGFAIVLPKGKPAVLINSLRYKDMLQDIVLLRRDPAKLEAKYKDILTAGQFRELREKLARPRPRDWAQSRPVHHRYLSAAARIHSGLLLQRTRPRRECRASLRREPVRCREASAHRFPGNAVGPGQ